MPTATRTAPAGPAATSTATGRHPTGRHPTGGHPTGGHPTGRPRRSAASGTKNDPANASTDNDSAPTDNDSDPAPAAGSSDTQVRAALADGQDLTVLAIAHTTGLGRSTVGKALNRLAAAGHATRTPQTGTGPTRTPERWNPAPTGQPGAEAGTGTGDRDTDSGAVEAPPVGTTTPTPDTASPPPTASPARTGEGPSSGDGTGDVGDTARNPVTGTAKLAPGALTPLVAAHFAAHPATALTAGEIGRALNRSGGAVRNACDRLVRDGDLTVASDSPRRYTLATTS